MLFVVVACVAVVDGNEKKTQTVVVWGTIPGQTLDSLIFSSPPRKIKFDNVYASKLELLLIVAWGVERKRG